MAISANKLIYDFERKLNAVNSGRANDYLVVDIVSFINDAYEIVISHLIAEKDQNETIRNHLRPLLVSNHELKCSETNDCNACEIKYPSDFYEGTSVMAKVCNDCCRGEKEIIVTKPQHDDLHTARKNPYRRSNFYFEQLIGIESKNGLLIYHDNEMDVLNVYLTYYRKINRVEAPELVGCEEDSYKNWDGKLISNNVDFEIESTYINNKITDVAVALAENSSKDYNAFQQKIQEIIQVNQLHK